MIPRPVTYRRTERGTVLSDGMAIVADGGPALPVAALLASEIEAATGWSVRRGGPAEQSPYGTVRLTYRHDAAALATSPEGQPESYQLKVDENGVEITAPSAAGLFYGTRTLRQLLPPDLLRRAPAHGASTHGAPTHGASERQDLGMSRPMGMSGPVPLEGCAIEDFPRFGWRGVGLDVSRHFFPKDFVMKLVDVAAMHKLNVLHLHLTDDQGWRVEIDTYPLLTQVGAWRRQSPVGHYSEGRTDGAPHGGFYTKQDLAEIISYAARRFVTILPEIDMPGHMQAAIASYPELGNTAERLEVYTNWGISDHILNLEEPTIRFCADVLREVMEVFPGPFVHIGGDECPTTEWAASEKAHARAESLGLVGVGDLQGWFTARMAEVVSAQGKTLVAWDEVLDAGAPAGSVIAVWRGEHAERTSAQAAREGHNVVMAPETWTYLDWSYDDGPREPVAIRPAISVQKAYSFEPVPAGLPDDLRQRIIGTQCQLWTEYVGTPDRAEYMYFPRACALAEVAWSQPSGQWQDFEARLVEHTRRLGAMGVNYRPLDGPNPGQARTWFAPGMQE